MISTSTLTDSEFDDQITIETQAYTKALYLEVLGVLDSREAVSNTRDRLAFYFKARGVDVGDAPSAGTSKIYLGSDLWS